MAPFEALYGRRCRFLIGWFEAGESSIYGPELSYKTLEKVHMIRYRLKRGYSQQKSYADNKRRVLEFEESGKVYVKI